MKKSTTLSQALTVVSLAVAFTLGTAYAQDLPKLEKKDRYKVGFSQMESNNP